MPGARWLPPLRTLALVGALAAASGTALAAVGSAWPTWVLLAVTAVYGATAKDIISANGLSADGFLRVGQQLLIPVGGPSGGPGPTATPQGGTLIYTVQAGDTVSLIADRFGSTMEWIFAANGLKPSSILHIGQSLQIPLSNVTPTVTPTVDASPSPTPTPGLPFRAPALLVPEDGAVVTWVRP